ncbi:MAG: NAD(P)H-binding protein, partial [Variovorax sp.]
AVVRSIAKAGDLAGATLVQGDARDETLLARALEGCTGVISAIGTSVSPFKEVTLLSTVTRSLVKVMTQKGVRRLVCITGLGAGDSRGHGGFVFDNIIMPLLLRKVYDDKNRQEELVRTSDLDWVLVRPVVLNDKNGTGKVRAGIDLSGIHGGSIARADVAQFVVDQLTDDRWLRQAPLIRQ